MEILSIKRKTHVYMEDDPFDATYIAVFGEIRFTPAREKPFVYPFRIAISHFCLLGDKAKNEMGRPAYQLHWDEPEMTYAVPYQETTPAVVGRTYILNQEGKDGFCTDQKKYTVLECEKDGTYTLYLKGNRKEPVNLPHSAIKSIDKCLEEIYAPYR